jgi:hypothetical protein
MPRSLTAANVADIFENDGAKERLIARWEGGDSKYSYGAPFTISDIIVKLTGKTSGTDVTRYMTFEHRPVESVEAELMRLAELEKAGAWIYSWESMAQWIRHVFQDETDKKKVKRLSLSDNSISELIQIAPDRPPYAREQFFKRIGIFLDESSTTRLKNSETSKQPVSK